MNVVNYPENQHQQIGATGNCPHCNVVSLLRPIASYTEIGLVASITRCENCKKFALVSGTRAGQHQGCASAVVYPLGQPNEAIPPEVPSTVAEDVKEAIRCHFIKSYRAAVVMCRRALQQSAIELQAKGGRLIDQIDDLQKQGRITESLRDFAHEVRITGNDGAHPDKDGLSDVVEGDSKLIMEFTQEYLHHVYVMPAKLAARRPPVVTVTV